MIKAGQHNIRGYAAKGREHDKDMIILAEPYGGVEIGDPRYVRRLATQEDVVGKPGNWQKIAATITKLNKDNFRGNLELRRSGRVTKRPNWQRDEGYG